MSAVENKLREEYFELLPEIERVLDEIETNIRHQLLPIRRQLQGFERLVVQSRTKSCLSAIGSLLRKQEGNTFVQSTPDKYSLTQLHDLAGVRVLVFPEAHLSEVTDALVQRFPGWVSDPVIDNENDGRVLAEKYYGKCKASATVTGEFQVLSMLIGLFWEVEHDTIYKPTPELEGIRDSAHLKKSRSKMIGALVQFEHEFAEILKSGGKYIEP